MADLSTKRRGPVTDLTSADGESILRDLESYVQVQHAAILSDFNPGQPGRLVLEALPYVGDLMAYHLNQGLRENFLSSAVRRKNFDASAGLIGYQLRGAKSATAIVRCTLDPSGTYPFPIERQSTRFATSNEIDGVIFQPTADINVLSYPVGGVIDVPCTEGEYHTQELVGVSNGAPNQRWQIALQDVVADSIILTVGASLWVRVPTFATQQSGANVYRVKQTDQGDTFLVFGDGNFGVIPASGQEYRASFRVGGGARGNVAEGTIRTKSGTHGNILSCTNPLPASGGLDPESIEEGRINAPASFSAQGRAVSDPDFSALAREVAGVRKVRVSNGLRGVNTVRLIVAPAGGGNPTDALQSDVQAFFRQKTMVNDRVYTDVPQYRQLRHNVLLHVNPRFRAVDVERLVKAQLLNGTSGLFDFENLDFGAVRYDETGAPTLLLSQTALQSFYGSFKGQGLDRAEISLLDVVPVARPRVGGNAGNGTLSVTGIGGNRRRRRYLITMVSATAFTVRESIVGHVSTLATKKLVDSTNRFTEEGVSSFAGWRLQPDSSVEALANVVSAAAYEVNVDVANLFSMTTPGSEYLLFPPIDMTGNAGVLFTTANVSLLLTPGTSPFLAGDRFELDVYPAVSDIRLRDDEYPVFAPEDVAVRSAGGLRL